jgi:hypothetical protein
MRKDHRPYGDQAAEHATELTRRTEDLLRSGTRFHAPWAPIGSVLVLVLGFWSWASIPVLHLPYTDPAWNTSLRDEGIAVLLVIAGLRLLYSPRDRLAATVAILAGLALVAFGIWMPHSADRGMLSEVITGVAVVGAALVALVPRR